MRIERFGLDSTSPVSTAAHHAVGSTVAIRYLSRYTPKVVTRSEYEADRRAGIDTYLVFEDMGRPDLSDYAGGKADAEFALKQAIDILGRPALPPCIPLAYDADPTGRSHLTDSYYDGAAAVLTRACTGPYGGDEVIHHQADRGFQILFPTYAWSGGRVDPRALKRGVYQYSNGHVVGGVGVDFNHVYGEDFGQWDRRLPAPVDPHHYLWFYEGPFAWGSFYRMNEREIVKRYDVLRAMQRPFHHPHRAECELLMRQCRALADRCWWVAHRDVNNGEFVMPGQWNRWHLGWRYQQLARRSQGRRLV